MRRFVFMALILLSPSVANAQTVNLEPPIDFVDVTQNERLDNLEAAVKTLTEQQTEDRVKLVAALDRLVDKLDVPPSPVKSQAILSTDPTPKAEVDERTFKQVAPGILENAMGERIVTEGGPRVQINRVNVPQGMMVQPVLVPIPDPYANAIVSTPPPQAIVQTTVNKTTVGRRSSEELRSIVNAHFPRGWNGQYATVSPQSDVWRHLQSHGFSASQTSGLTQNEALGLHAMAHKGLVSPSGPSSIVSGEAEDPGCLNGQCNKRGVSTIVNVNTRQGDGYGPFGIIKWR